MARLNFSRQILPVVAVIAIIVAAIIVLRTQPDRALAEPVRTPPSAAANGRATVAGAGVIEPAGELIEMGRADARARHEELCAFFADA